MLLYSHYLLVITLLLFTFFFVVGLVGLTILIFAILTPLLALTITLCSLLYYFFTLFLILFLLLQFVNRVIRYTYSYIILRIKYRLRLVRNFVNLYKQEQIDQYDQYVKLINNRLYVISYTIIVISILWNLFWFFFTLYLHFFDIIFALTILLLCLLL